MPNPQLTFPANFTPVSGMAYANADNSAQIVSATSPLPMQPGFVAPGAWAAPATPWDARAFGVVTIFCTTAPTTPYTITQSDGIAAAFTATAIGNNGSGITSTTTIAAIGRYDLPGRAFVALTGGAGGTFSIAGGQ